LKGTWHCPGLYNNMPIVVGVSLRAAGKIYFFDPKEEDYHRCEKVLVETVRGPEIGVIKIPPHEVEEEKIVHPLKPVIRRLTMGDIKHAEYNHEREARAVEICQKYVLKLELPMQLIDAQYTFDGSNVLIHFYADNRVDFRELVRELARELHTRIELRQVGVRDEAKILGGFGMCGQQLCCSRFLTGFIPVAINMAKEQGLALNPQKISGCCGRLMCCLAYEFEQYRELRESMPGINAIVKTSAGTGKVMKVNPLTGILEVYIEGEKNLLSCKTADVVVLQQGDSGLDVSDVPIEATAAEIAAIVDEDIPIPEASNDSYSVSTRQNRFQPVDNEPANMRRNDNRPRQDNRPQNDYRGNRPNTDTNNTNRPTPPPANVPPPQHPQRRRIIEPESSQEYEQMRKAQNQQNSGGPGNAPRPNNGPNRNQNPNPNAPRNNQNRPNNNFRRNRNDQGGNV
jgi:cell fate regulator YaaT (PSP1 superfamily)